MKDAVHILVVDDNPGDVRLIREGLNESGANYQMDVAADGEEALAYLNRLGKWNRAPQPSLIFLDLKLPRKDGLAVLAEVKQDPRLRNTPVIVWTSSAAAVDVKRSYELNANCYVQKPADFDGCVAALSRISEFWFRTAVLPPK